MTVTPIDGFATDVLSTAQLGDSGIILNGTDTYGVTWDWNDADAFGPKPAPRDVTGDRSYRDGQWDATQFYGPRTRPMTGTVHAPTNAALVAARQRLFDALGVDAIKVTYIEPGFQGYTIGRQSGEMLWTPTGASDFNNRPLEASFSIGLYSSDPLFYSTVQHSFSLAFPSASGGMTWASTGASWASPGASWGGTGTISTVSVNNPGSRSVGVRLHFTGPVVSAVVTVQQGPLFQALNLLRPVTDPGSILAAGEVFDIDTDTHSALLQTTANRRSWVYGDWLALPPGDSTVTLVGAYDPAAGMTGTFRAARL